MHEAVMVLKGRLHSGDVQIAYVNPAFTRMTGYELDDVQGASPNVLWGRQSDRATLDHAVRELRAGRAFEGRIIGYRKNGNPFLVDGYAEPLPTGPSQDQELLVVMRDVTEETPRDAAMRHIVAALDHVEEAIVVLSIDRSIRYLNRAANEIFGDDDGIKIPLPRNAWKQLEQGLSWTGGAIACTPSGDRQLDVDVQQVHGFDGEPSLLVIARDVTDVERLQSIADSVNLSDNLGHFLSGIRHELGNPVNSIKTALTVLRSNLETFGPLKVHDYLQRVLGEVERIEFLLSSLRSFSRHESVTLHRIELPVLLREVVALVQPSVRDSGVTLVVEPPPAVSVIADERALYQILLNLVSNAIEAPRDHGDKVIRVETMARSEYVDIAVVDNGRGMTADELDNALRPFFTTKRTGTGLGLVIANRLAANQGGRLRLLSTPGEGTRAVVSLARAPQREDMA
ncbi:MAG: PAS domain-containing protein [Myxococcales bacterium]|nr:PAS domain-containing protein [Myxococcales bacterium]MCB9715169.1 PAS domain-containing protein [Myxococcales bacterium]